MDNMRYKVNSIHELAERNSVLDATAFDSSGMSCWYYINIDGQWFRRTRGCVGWSECDSPQKSLNKINKIAYEQTLMLEAREKWILTKHFLPSFSTEKFLPLILCLERGTVLEGGWQDDKFWISGEVFDNVRAWRLFPNPPEL